jgi:hypothetical protein
MKRTLLLLLLALPPVLAGCDHAPPPPRNTSASDEDKIKANLAKLDPEERKLAEEQKYCALENENRLGSMGVPVKVVLKGEPVFLCCKGCRKEVEADPDKALAKLKELRAKNTGRE